MSSMVVDQCFNTAQNGVYAFELTLSNSNIEYRGQTYRQIEAVIGGENQYPILSRLLALPISIIDLSLECVCTVAQALEKVACLIFSGVIVISEIIGSRLTYWNGVKSSCRVLVLNFHDAVRYTLKIPAKVITEPFIATAQCGLILLDPQKALPTYQALYAKAESFSGVNHFVENVFNIVKKVLFKRAIEYAGYSSSTVRGSIVPNPHPFKSRIYALPIAIIDPLLDSLRSLCVLVCDVVASVFIFVATPFVFAIARDGYKQGLNTYRVALFFLSSIPATLVNCVTKVVMLPITMIAQIGSILSDPQRIAPSRNWLYSSQIGDKRLAITHYRFSIQVMSQAAGGGAVWKTSYTF